MKIHFLAILAGAAHTNFGAFETVVRKRPAGSILLKGGYAFATLGGVQDFLKRTTPLANWDPTPKQFLIGLHHGITEPSALSLLDKIPNSTTRVFIPGGRLNLAALYAKPVYHPKVLALEAPGGALCFLQAGSANLTSSAIGESPKNHEFSVATEAERETSIDPENTFRSWWSAIWNASREIEPALIAKYGELRLEVLKRNPILRTTVAAPESISTATHFFCEVGAGSGPPGFRHQIEFPESLARFFGRPVRHRRDLTLRRPDRSWPRRPLSHKRTTYGVDIWRLGMPTQASGGEPIAERAIRFSRNVDANTFNYEIRDVGSPTYRAWVNAANLAGHLGETFGQRPRQYGFY